MTTVSVNTPDALKQAAQSLQEEEERLDTLRRKYDLDRAEADNLERQAQDMRKKMLSDARKADTELKSIAEQEKEIKESDSYVAAKDRMDRTRKDSGLEQLGLDKKERRQQIEESVDADPELQEMRRMAEVKAKEATDSEVQLQELEQRVTAEARQLIARVAGMQLSLF